MAIECLGTVYGIDSSDSNSTSHLNCEKPLLDIFTEAINEVHIEL